MPNTNPIKPENGDIARKIRLLRAHTKQTGMITTKSVNTLLARLAPDDLVEVLEALELQPQSDAGVRRYDPQGNLIRQ
jgi:hypothetical protein